jgi:hypothetical protein
MAGRPPSNAFDALVVGERADFARVRPPILGLLHVRAVRDYSGSTPRRAQAFLHDRATASARRFPTGPPPKLRIRPLIALLLCCVAPGEGQSPADARGSLTS